MTNLSKKLGEMNFDGLFTDVVPAVQVRGGIIRKQTTSAVTLKRGTILAKSYGTAGDGKLVILGSTAANNETLTPDCVLCDDVEVGTAADENVAVYTAGCFDPDKVTVAECFACPIASGCSWCSAYNYQCTGTPDKRVTYICPMHKARVLANAYYWNNLYRKRGDTARYRLDIPDAWALEIIPYAELSMLKSISKEG